MPTHTREPWQVISYSDDGSLPHLANESGIEISDCFLNKEDARRAAACVNFLAGIPTDVLEGEPPDEVMQRCLDRLKKKE